MDTYYNFTTVMDRVPAHIDSIITALFPKAKKEPGCYRIGGTDGSEGRSLKIDTSPNKAGVFTDHSDSSVKGNIFSLVAQARNCSYQEAGEWLARFLGVSPEEKFFAKKRNRPVPKIEKEGVHKLSKDCKASKYAESRGIELNTLLNFRAACTETAICFPHFDDKDRCVLVKYWSCDDRKQVWTNKDPIHVLFGKHLVDPKKTGGYVIICEGQWDAMTWAQAGYAAVSIPSGTENDEWIAEDWMWLNQFTEIFLDFDNDESGRAAELRVKTRLGYERCRTIRYNHKDANEVVKVLGWDAAAEVFKQSFFESRNAAIEHIVDASVLRTAVKDKLSNTNRANGVPFFLSRLNIQFRPHESTIWYGYTSHGKSTAIENQIAFQAGLGIHTMVASFENNTVANIASMLVQFTADENIAGKEYFDMAYDSLKERVIMFDSQRRTSPDQLIATMTLAHKQLGICSFVIDNVMTLDTDRQDNTAQAETADKLRIFVAKYPVHLHVVAHPRKPSEIVNRPPSLAEVRGASEWGDMTFNAICIYRDMMKAEKIETMWDENIDRAEIEHFRRSCPDGKFLVKKQRFNGHLPICGVNFESSIKRYYRDQEELAPYWTPPDDTTEPEDYQPQTPTESQPF